MAKKRILCFGDSNTYGYDPQSYFGSRYAEDERWTGLLQRPDLNVVNCGQNGRTIPTERDFPVVDRLLRSKMPLDMIVVMLGSNDLPELRTAERVAVRMRGFLEHLLEILDREEMLLISPPVMQRGTWIQSAEMIEESGKLGACYDTLARELEIGFADAAKWGIELSFDGVHFTAAGHTVFAKEMEILLDRLK